MAKFSGKWKNYMLMNKTFGGIDSQKKKNECIHQAYNGMLKENNKRCYTFKRHLQLALKLSCDSCF